jgi:hypothetical protein
VDHSEYLGDGWCDVDVYNSVLCNFDRGDCCPGTCQGTLCGSNGWANCLNSSAAEAPFTSERRQAQSAEIRSKARTQRIATEGSLERAANEDSLENSYDAIEAIATERCAPEFTACFDDGDCGHLFMVGSVTRSSELLRRLFKCIEDFDGDADFDYFQVTPAVYYDGEFGRCVANYCRVPYMLCQVSLECFLGEDTEAGLELDACIDERCELKPEPTPAPTRQPHVYNSAYATGLLFEIGGEGSFSVEYKHVTVGNIQEIPIGGSNALEGHVVVTSSCVLTDSGGVAADLEGAFVIVKRGCNVYDTTRLAAGQGAIVVVFAADEFASNQWVPRDEDLKLPVLSIGYADADAIQRMFRRGKQVRGRLSSKYYCDAMHVSGVDAFSTLESVGGTNCCMAGDVVLSHILLEHDRKVGVREFPFCRAPDSNPDGDLTMVCLDPVVAFADVVFLCENICKRNGVCEDGGQGSVAHSCAWGGDCQDCGPRHMDDGAASGIAYGWPTSGEYERAVEFVCGTREGVHCQDALTSKYDEFHGEGNVYSSIMATLCMDSTCALEDGLFRYDLPQGSGASCCFAAQIVAAFLLEHTFHHDSRGTASFVDLCASGLNVGESFNFTCVEEDRRGGEVGSADAVATTLRPALGNVSFNLARNVVCASRGCSDMAWSMLTTLRQQVAEGNSKPAPLLFYFSAMDTCDATMGVSDVAFCTLLPFAEYLAVETPASLAGGDPALTCCEASAVVIVDLMRGSDRSMFDRDVCPSGEPGCDAVLALLHADLNDAKDVVKNAAGCFETTWGLIHAMQGSSGAVGLYGGILDHMKRERFVTYVNNGSVCWLQWLLEKTPMDKPTSCCDAADVVLAHHIWLHEPAIAPDVYSPAARDAASDEALALALSTICEHPGWDSDLDMLMHPSRAVLGAGLSFQAMCADPCRCANPGCTVGGANEGQYGRPICYVVDPAACESSRSSVHEEGEAWKYCSVGHDTCQKFGLEPGPCAPFVEGRTVYVPKGTTLESLQFLQGDAAATEVGVASGNLLKAWLLEAALVSPQSYAAHGSVVCGSRLRPCDSKSMIPRPQHVCNVNCTSAFARKAKVGQVFSDPLRGYDGNTVCDWRLLPSGFQRAMVPELDSADVSHLQTVLGIDEMLAGDWGFADASRFGYHVYPNASRCRSFDDGTISVSKALDEISCPDRFIKNTAVTMDGSDAFCVGTCPSNAYSSDERSMLWQFFVIPGMVAFVVNLLALACLRLGTHSKRTDVATMMLICLAVMSGLLGVVPVALLRDDLLCECDSELCFSTGALCKLNQTSIFVVMASCLCLLYKSAVLLTKLGTPQFKHLHFDNPIVLQLVWIVPLFFALASFMAEDSDNTRFHLARAGVHCQFRYKSFMEEAVLLHVPMSVCVLVMAYLIFANMRICMRVLLLQSQNRSFRDFSKLMQKRPQLRKMLVISTVTLALALLWLSQAVASARVFNHYFEAVDEWLRCIRFDFARHAAVGDLWDEVVSTNHDGVLCPAAPTGIGLYESQLSKSIFEALMPLLVAVAFSGKPVSEAVVFWVRSAGQRHFPNRFPSTAHRARHGPSSVNVGDSAVIENRIALMAPRAVDAIISCEIKSVQELQHLAPAVVKWLKTALFRAHESEELKTRLKQLLGAPLFCVNLRYLKLWEGLIHDCKDKALELGQEMQRYFVENDLATALGEEAAPNEYGLAEMVLVPQNAAVNKPRALAKLRTPSSTSSSSSVHPTPDDKEATRVSGPPKAETSTTLSPPPSLSNGVFVVKPSTIGPFTKRQDHVLPAAFPLNLSHSQEWNEQCFIHCMRLLAMGIDAGYQRAVGRLCESSKGNFKAAPIKGYKRMRNKMTSIDDHLLEVYPRPGLNIDLNRNCCTFGCPTDLLSFISEMKQHPMFGGHPVRMKNMFHFDDKRAEKQFYYRTVMVNWLYTPGLTYRELAEFAKDLWDKYYNFECVPGYGDKDPSQSWGTWRKQIGVAIAYLTSPEIANKKVQFIVETQLLLHPYLLGRQKMHLLYKVCRANDPEALYKDFLVKSNPEMRPYEDVENAALKDMVSFLGTTSDVNAQHEALKGATQLWKAAEQGHVKAVKKILEHPNIDPNKLRLETRTSPLYIASFHGHEEVVKAILAHPQVKVNLGKIDVKVSPLFVAVEQNREGVVEALLGANDIVVNAITSTGVNPLYEACDQGREHIVKLLVSKELNDPCTLLNLATVRRSCHAGLSIAEQKDYDRIETILVEYSQTLGGIHDAQGSVIMGPWAADRSLKSKASKMMHLDYDQENRYSTIERFMFEDSIPEKDALKPPLKIGGGKESCLRKGLPPPAKEMD